MVFYRIAATKLPKRERKKRTVEEKNIVGNEFDFQNFSWKSAVIDSEKKDAFSAVRVRAGAPSLALSKLYCAKMPTTMQTETCWLLLSNTQWKFYWISFGRSHNNRLCFYRCKIPLDGSNRLWYINHWTWGKYYWVRARACPRVRARQKMHPFSQSLSLLTFN